MEFNELIFEVSPFRSSILKEIDKNFAQIKKDKKDLAAKKELTNNIKEFTGVKNVIINIKKDYMNAAVIPIYNQIISADLVTIFKDYETGDNIKDLEIVEEPSKYIKKMYIMFGDQLIDMFSPRELTAILLHELGHCYTYTANLPRIILALLQKGLGVAGMMLKTPILWIFNMITLPAYIVASLIVITIVRSLTFVEHRGEYKADQFAAKYSYGDEMIKVLYRLHNRQMEKEAKQGWLEKVWNFIERIFSPASHPTSSSRIEELNDQMLNDYKKLYPKLSDELNIILKDIKNS